MTYPNAHRDDLIRAARSVLNAAPHLATKLTVNENAGTVSDRVTGEVHAFVAPEYSAMGPVEFIGWSQWPRKLAV